MQNFSFDAAGKAKVPSAEQFAHADANIGILTYVQGKMADGRPYYAYVSVVPSRYIEFRRKNAAHATMTLSEYGKVLAADFEEEAPPEVMQEMCERYGFDENYEATLRAECVSQQKAHFEKQEEVRISNIVEMLKHRPH